MAVTSVASTFPSDELMAGTLRRSHDAWIAEARRFLEPALEAGADFWSQWGAVRYVADTFRERLRRECALVGELRPLLSPDVSARLDRGREQVARSGLELDRIGRRRGTAVEVAAAIRQLLADLGVWCAEIESAATVLGRRGARLP